MTRLGPFVAAVTEFPVPPDALCTSRGRDFCLGDLQVSKQLSTVAKRGLGPWVSRCSCHPVVPNGCGVSDTSGTRIPQGGWGALI